MPDDIASQLFSPPGAPAEFGIAAPRQSLLARLESATIGRRGADGALVVRRSDPAGCLLFGPFWRLPGGRYRLEFTCRPRRPRLSRQPVLGVEVIALNRHQQAWRDFTCEELAEGIGAVLFDVPPILSLEAGEEVRFEFRFFHLGNADLRIDGVALQQTDPASGAASESRRWRLFGRFAKSAIGRRRTDGAVRVRRFEPAGVVLRGAWPYLRLPEGRYRLRLSCCCAAVRRAGAPTVAVEFVGHSRWRGTRLGPLWPWPAPPSGAAWVVAAAEFTAEQLGGGPASMDVTVPYDLALESGEDIPLEFRVRHFGNADLIFENLELQRVDDEADTAADSADAAVAPRPPQSARRNVLVIGNCQAETVRQAFMRAAPLADRFRSKYHFVELPKHLHDIGRRDLADADVLLVQDISDWESYPLREKVRDGIEIIKFPLVRLASLWPFDHYNGPGDKEAYQREWPNLTFQYQDGLLGRLRRQIPDKEARFAAYRRLDMPGLVNIARLHDFEQRRLLAMDRQFGFDVGAYILERFRHEQVFYTTNHPSGVVFGRLMQWLMRRLGLDERFPTIAQLDQLRRLQVPIHPKVAEALGVRWADENTRYLYEGRRITWERYTRAYIDHYG